MSYVLVVDDDEVTRRITVKVIEAMGGSAVCVSSGLEAITHLALRRPLPALVLLDISMPGMDGFGTLQRIRALPGEAGAVPVVFVTGVWDAETFARSTVAGVPCWVKGTYTAEQLGHRIAKFVPLPRLPIIEDSTAEKQLPQGMFPMPVSGDAATTPDGPA